ncbi:hypothetical protein ATANTOWER_023076 [Ataeniobius toweri]|uniref:Uncharacterized protein n=1 Tax=Ataeniobius toweri TaxID=208326 RepID=A0ABU7BB36_9TELE|nr:hypothetical protein [Ataeniobius toweri]
MLRFIYLKKTLLETPLFRFNCNGDGTKRGKNKQSKKERGRIKKKKREKEKRMEERKKKKIIQDPRRLLLHLQKHIKQQQCYRKVHVTKQCKMYLVVTPAQYRTSVYLLTPVGVSVSALEYIRFLH